MYAPYGEQLLNQQSTTTYNERFTFTGKERDKETGYVHFDARNLFEVASIWLSTDPLLDKYIYNSPYVYCDGNPIKFVDPDGRKVGISGVYNNEDGTTRSEIFYYSEVDGVKGFYHNNQRLDSEFANKATEAIGRIHDGGQYGKMLIDAIVKDDRTIYLCQKKDYNGARRAFSRLDWTANDFTLGFLKVPSFISLSHEFAHFISAWYGFADYREWYRIENDNTVEIIRNDEKWVVNVENLIRSENQLELRPYYTMPHSYGESGIGEIPHWEWVKDLLKIVCTF